MPTSREPPNPMRLSGAVEVLRKAWRNDGAEGESVHLVCDAVEWYRDTLAETSEAYTLTPVPMLLWCPACHERHVDEGEFATKPHATHACQKCGLVWKPAKVPTVGVQFLPGYRDEV